MTYASSEHTTEPTPELTVEFASQANFSRFYGDGVNLHVEYDIAFEDAELGGQTAAELSIVKYVDGLPAETLLTQTVDGTSDTTHVLTVPLTTAISNPEEEFTLFASLSSDNGVTRTMEIEGGIFRDGAHAWHVFGGDAINQITVNGDSVSLTGSVNSSVSASPSIDIDFLATPPQSYAGSQDQDSTAYAVEDNGATLHFTGGNTWKGIALGQTITPNTVLEFDFWSDHEGEIHAIGVGTTLSTWQNGFKFEIFGDQGWNPGASSYSTAYADYELPDGVKHYNIPIGQILQQQNSSLLTNMAYMTFANDDDPSPRDATAKWSNIRLYESTTATSPTAIYIQAGDGSDQIDIDAAGTAPIYINGGKDNDGITIAAGVEVDVTISDRHGIDSVDLGQWSGGAFTVDTASTSTQSVVTRRRSDYV